ncbi:MAG: hypothetical protein HKN92_04315 [Chitinophagales bacterium]|nr:hypothetical protein [Chitinophagales bacterium]
MRSILLVILLTIFLIPDSSAQIMNRAMKQYNLEDIKPEDIPSAATLRFMGVPEEQIEKAMEFKEGRKTIGELERDFDMINEDTSEIEVIEVPAPVIPDVVDNVDENSIFGKDYFKNTNIKIYQQSDFTKAPANYIIGPEDILSISVWGYSEYDGEFKVDSDGYIKPKDIGRIYLKGIPFERAQSLIASKFSNYLDLRNSQIAITLIYSRTITVNIVGEVENPGSYSIAAINTAFNALIAAGGINDLGSVRNIFIKRDGKTIKTLDVYEFLFNPDSREDYFLQNNDYIFVPKSAKIVRIRGEVSRPMAYELKKTEHLKALIKYAGGFKPTAITTSLHLQRYMNNQLIILDIAYDSLMKMNSNFELLGGDTIFVSKIPDILSNFVEIEGAVKRSGKFEFYEGMKVSDLLSKAEGLLEKSYTDRAYLMRVKPDLSNIYIPVKLDEVLMGSNPAADLKLQQFDKLRVFSKNEFSELYTVSIDGAVRKPGLFLYGDNMTLKDLLYFSGGLKPEAANNRIEISRIINYDESVKRGVPSMTVIEIIEIGKDLSIDFESERITLLPFDKVYVRETPDFKMQRSITITGEVKYPGLYSLKSADERMTGLIKRAGGFTKEAFVDGMKLFRSQNKTGFVFVDYEMAIKKTDSKYNYILEDGDEIMIPRLNELVKIRGHVNYPGMDTIYQINTPYLGGRRANFYINSYGAGFEREAKKARTYVQLPSGYVRNTKNFGLFKVFPKVEAGSTIVVQDKRVKKKKEKRAKEPKDPAQVNAIVASVSTSFTTLLTLYLVLRDLNR